MLTGNYQESGDAVLKLGWGASKLFYLSGDGDMQ